MLIVERFTSRVIALPRNDVTTDELLPPRFLTCPDKAGLGQHLFAELRLLPDGTPDPSFPLNQARPGKKPRVLMAGSRFGCGTPRDQAAGALVGAGFRAVVARSFAEAFAISALKSSLIPIALSAPDHAALVQELAAHPDLWLAIDLPAQAVQWPGGRPLRFAIDHYAKMCLISGNDDLAFVLKHARAVHEFEARRQEDFHE
ncbi:MAG: 3-isopropylmalate dehydratase small subunit [Deltaproteobacteria bacterium]|nr:3-isopropylmalate dehydratase small subunit [Deltaproteobacteria bacterium]